MALLDAGYWQTTYWPSRYWQADYWPEYGAVTPVGAVAGRRRRYRKPRSRLSRDVLGLVKEYLEMKTHG